VWIIAVEALFRKNQNKRKLKIFHILKILLVNVINYTHNDANTPRMEISGELNVMQNAYCTRAYSSWRIANIIL
jgi:hypothetical protein